MAALSACSILNPYASEFSCPKGDPGKCQSIQKNYEESFGPASDGLEESDAETCDGEKAGAPSTVGEVETTYREQLLARFGELLESPEAPVVMPPQTMRILILPYRGKDGELFMGRYVYVFTEGPRWVLEDIR